MKANNNSRKTNLKTYRTRTHSQSNKTINLSKIGLLGACIAACNLAYAQADGIEEEVIVTGTYQQSLQAAIDMKRNSTAFTDAITAEDVGKFPDNNLAEALQRIPGVQITRTNGEGQQVAMRGLGAQYTRILLNNMPISIASQGGVEQTSRSREVDLDIFPSELFSAVEVSKTSRASLPEGGLAGTVNLRTGRPFDYDGFVASGSLQASYSDSSEEVDPRGSFVISNTWNEKFGALLSVAVSERSYQTEATTTIEWDNGRVDNPTTPDLNPDPDVFGLDYPNGGFQWDTSNGNATTLPGSGFDTYADLNAMIVPRLARPDFQLGTRDRTGANLALQWRPTDEFDINFEVLYANLESDFRRYTNNHLVRNTGPTSIFGFIEPQNFVVDENNTAISGTFNGSRYWSENRVYNFDTDFLQFSLSGDWQRDNWTVEWYASSNESNHDVTHTTILFMSDPTVTEYELVGGYPVLTPRINGVDPMSNPTYWNTDDIRVQPFEREDTNDNIKVDLIYGGDENNIRLGVHQHEFTRDTVSRDWADDFEETAFLEVANLLGADLNVTDIHDLDDSVYGTASPVFGGNLDTTMGYDQWMVADFGQWGVNWQALDGYANISPSETDYMKETNTSVYIEGNTVQEFYGRDVRINAGLRHVSTDVELASPLSVNTAPDANDYTTFVTDANELAKVELSSDYSHTLPSLNIAIDATDDVIVRMAAGRSMTRQSPRDLRANAVVSISGDVNQGNPNLSPYFAHYFDFGTEWYITENTLLAGSFFRKEVTGFIEQQTVRRPFSEAGIPLEILDGAQRAALTDGLSTVVPFTTPVNIDDELIIDGFELQYQQPLDGVMNGLGFLANYTFANANSDEVPGLSDESYNLVSYLEREQFSVRLSYNYRSDFFVGNGNQNASLPIFTEEASYVDFSSSYRLPVDMDLELTFEALNLTNETERRYIGEPERVFELYRPGAVYLLGIRGKF